MNKPSRVKTGILLGAVWVIQSMILIWGYVRMRDGMDTPSSELDEFVMTMGFTPGRFFSWEEAVLPSAW